MPRRLSIVLLLVAVLGLANLGSAAPAPAASTRVAKKCHYVTKKVHGKKKWVKVCKKVKPTPKPTRTPTVTPSPTPTATPEPLGIVSGIPAFPGVPAGGFVAGLSTQAPAAMRSGRLHKHDFPAGAFGGENLDPIQATYVSDGASQSASIKVFTIADARGFTADQHVCLYSNHPLPLINGALRFCSTIFRLTPAPTANYPNAAAITLLPAHQSNPNVSVEEEVNIVNQEGVPEGLELQCDNVTIRPSDGTEAGIGDILTWSSKPNDAAVVDGADGKNVTVPVIENDLKPEDIWNSAAPSKLVQPGTKLTVIPGPVAATIFPEKNEMIIQYTNLPKWPWNQVTFFGLQMPSGSEIALCTNCQMTTGTALGDPTTTFGGSFGLSPSGLSGINAPPGFAGLDPLAGIQTGDPMIIRLGASDGRSLILQATAKRPILARDLDTRLR